MITIINYNMGNLGSIQNMLKRIGQDSFITNRIEDIDNAEKIILPGVGSYDQAMQNLNNMNLVGLLRKKALQDKIPILGICLGMQILGQTSQEGESNGLGLIEGSVVKFKIPKSYKLKIPHMGWNILNPINQAPLLTGIDRSYRFYFVHSYHFVCSYESNILSSTKYGISFTSSICRNNIMGVQFHPEKSHKFGMKVLENFSSI